MKDLRIRKLVYAALMAALTYVAALFSSVLQLLRLMMLTRGGDSRRK